MGVVLWVVLFENDGPHRKEKLPDFPFFFWSMRMDWERAACDHFYTCTFSAKNWPFSKLYEHHCEALMRQLSPHPKRQPHVNFSTWFWMGAILIFGLKQHFSCAFLLLWCLTTNSYDNRRKSDIWTSLSQFVYFMVLSWSGYCLSQGGSVHLHLCAFHVLVCIWSFCFGALLWHVYNVLFPHCPIIGKW